MCQSNLRETIPQGQFIKEHTSRGSSRGFQIVIGVLQRQILPKKRDPTPFRKLPRELLILVRSESAKPMVKVCERQIDTEFVQHEEETYGICAAGHADQHTITRYDHLVFADRLLNMECE